MTRVYIADDHAIMREGLRRLLQETPDLTIVGETGKGREALERAQQDDVDVLILDLSLEDIGGLEVIRQLRELRPALPIVVLSMYPEEQYAVRVLRMGVKAYVTKGRPSGELIEAIRSAARGRVHLTSGTNRAVLAGGGVPTDQLSDREHQIFTLLAQGRTNAEIAAELDVSASTVSTHIVHIREKLGVRTNGEIIQYAYRSGLLPGRA